MPDSTEPPIPSLKAGERHPAFEGRADLEDACGIVSFDLGRACLLPRGHEGKHGFPATPGKGEDDVTSAAERAWEEYLHEQPWRHNNHRHDLFLAGYAACEAHYAPLVEAGEAWLEAWKESHGKPFTAGDPAGENRWKALGRAEDALVAALRAALDQAKEGE